MGLGSQSFGSTIFGGLNLRADMTKSVSTQYIRDTNQSLYYFLTNEVYARSGASSYSENTLKGFFSGLNISLGHVDDLEKLPLPAIALVTPTNIVGGQDQAFGNHVSEEVFTYSIQGYMGGQESHNNNMIERDKLGEDLKSLLEDQDYITLMQFDGSDVVDSGGDIAIMNVTLSFLPPIEKPEASRYRFIVNFDVELLKKI
jgi:hypothetical protein